MQCMLLEDMDLLKSGSDCSSVRVAEALNYGSDKLKKISELESSVLRR